MQIHTHVSTHIMHTHTHTHTHTQTHTHIQAHLLARIRSREGAPELPAGCEQPLGHHAPLRAGARNYDGLEVRQVIILVRRNVLGAGQARGTRGAAGLLQSVVV
ncbi:hypothetical protein EON64_00020 [archaeon]|nr:MAG: hypothetical protein EON64_00020 [archaeon]